MLCRLGGKSSSSSALSVHDPFRHPGRALRTPPSYSGDLPTGSPNSRVPPWGNGPPPEGFGQSSKGQAFKLLVSLAAAFVGPLFLKRYAVDFVTVHAHAEPIVSFARDAIRDASKGCVKRMCRYNVK